MFLHSLWVEIESRAQQTKEENRHRQTVERNSEAFPVVPGRTRGLRCI